MCCFKKNNKTGEIVLAYIHTEEIQEDTEQADSSGYLGVPD